MALTPRGKFGAFSGVIETGVSKHTTVDYTGDGTNNREIDLGDDYDLVLIFLVGTDPSGNHMALAYALRTGVWGGFRFLWGSQWIRHDSGANIDNFWQGKMSGADANKIMLSAVGDDQYGTNRTGRDYRVLGLKLS